jgi:hypothetical protein
MTALQRDDRGRIIRPAIEYNVVDHCNLRCAACDHASPHLTRRFADPEAFATDMEALSGHLHVRFLRLIGGEPLLHPALDAFVRAARKTGIADQLMLWTNGLLLHTVCEELLAGFDVVRVSLYPGVRLQVDLAGLAQHLEKGNRTRLEVVKVRRFQHQLLNDPITDSKIVQRTYLRCKDAHSLSCHTVCAGRYYKCAKAPVLEPRLARCGVQIANRARDGVALHDNPYLAEELARYLRSSEPLMACTWCLGTDGKSLAHHQLDETSMQLEQRTGMVDPRGLMANMGRRLVRDVRDSFARL